MAKKHKEWLVTQWKGYNHEDDIWEPLEVFEESVTENKQKMMVHGDRGQKKEETQ